MVSTSLYNRADIKDNLDELYTCISIEDWGNAKNASDKLLNNLLKYYNSRGIDANHFYELFEELNYNLLYTTNNHFKKQIVHDSLRRIINEIRCSTKDPLSRLREIYGDIRHLLGDITKKNANEIIDCFEELADLRPAMEEIGGTVYNYYSIMMQKVGDCTSTVRRISNSRPSEQIYSQVEEKFAGLFQAIEKVLTPPVRLKISREEVYRKIKEGIPISELSEATGQTEEDLRLIFQQEQLSKISEEE